MRKLRVGDIVRIIAGDDKGREGRILRFTKDLKRVYVEGINLVKKHIRKGVLKKDSPGTVVQVEAPIDRSNVMLICPSCKKPTRVKIVVKDGKKLRVCAKCKALIDVKSNKKNDKNNKIKK